MYRIIKVSIDVTIGGTPRRLNANGSSLAVVVAATVSEAATPRVPLMTIPHAA
jgi:hypothetical protein